MISWCTLWPRVWSLRSCLQLCEAGGGLVSDRSRSRAILLEAAKRQLFPPFRSLGNVALEASRLPQMAAASLPKAALESRHRSLRPKAWTSAPLRRSLGRYRRSGHTGYAPLRPSRSGPGPYGPRGNWAWIPTSALPSGSAVESGVSVAEHQLWVSQNPPLLTMLD